MAENKFFGCTDPAQAKALIKAGLDPDSFDLLMDGHIERCLGSRGESRF